MGVQMLCNHILRVFTCLAIFFAITFSPFNLAAQQTTMTVDHEAGFYYTVQKKDTLWDLSQRFSDSPWLWPDLWKENNQILNPHRIYPGMRIRLFHQAGVESYVVKTAEKKPLSQQEPEPPKERPYYYYSPIESIGFISKTPVTPHGYIFKSKDDKIMISTGDLVYIMQQNDMPYALGDKYAVYRTLDPLTDTKTKAHIGVQHYLTGVVEIINKEPRFAIAKVIQSFRNIGINDLLIPYKKRDPKIILTASQPGLNGKILLTEEQDTLMGGNTIAFINKGQEDGVEIGQSYSIYYQEKEKIGKKQDLLLPPVIYGTLLVLHTESTTSTVIITNAEKTVYSGASFRSPTE
jgi:hypothetical protein